MFSVLSSRFSSSVVCVYVCDERDCFTHFLHISEKKRNNSDEFLHRAHRFRSDTIYLMDEKIVLSFEFGSPTTWINEHGFRSEVGSIVCVWKCDAPQTKPQQNWINLHFLFRFRSLRFRPFELKIWIILFFYLDLFGTHIMCCVVKNNSQLLCAPFEIRPFQEFSVLLFFLYRFYFSVFFSWGLFCPICIQSQLSFGDTTESKQKPKLRTRPISMKYCVIFAVKTNKWKRCMFSSFTLSSCLLLDGSPKGPEIIKQMEITRLGYILSLSHFSHVHFFLHDV